MHRWSQLFIPTLREAPADAEVASHKLLLRGGYMRQLGAGIYSYLFLGNRSVNKIVAIIREEMDAIGQEMLLPTIHPRELWESSGRWTTMGENMFRLQDRKGAELCLGMTHEEVVTDIARRELRSYKQLPQIWYQIQTKFRDEPRPKAGLLRVRQFLMKDAYSFDIDEASLDVSYQKHDRAYRRIFSRCGLEFVAVEADSGAMGGSQSQEFMVYTEAGEDLIASSPSGYAANLEKATSIILPVDDSEHIDKNLTKVLTPGTTTINSVAQFLGVSKDRTIKTLAMMGTYDSGGRQVPIAVFLRGDHDLNEAKLKALLDLEDIRPMDENQISLHFNTVPGYLGPIGLTKENLADYKARRRRRSSSLHAGPEIKILTITDAALRGRIGLVAGANQEHYHFAGVTPTIHYPVSVEEFADIRNILEGELDPIGRQPLRLGKAVEIGHIFKLGNRYTSTMGASVLNKEGKETTPIMGCYGIGVERILTAAIETSAAAHAGEAYALPPAIAPFQVVVTITNVSEAPLLAAGEQVAADLTKAGFDVLLDDRDERAGVKFKDADLIGIPYRINIGRGVAEGQIEFVDRLKKQTVNLSLDQAVFHLASTLEATEPSA